MYEKLTRTLFYTNALLSDTDVVLHTTDDDVSMSCVIQLNAGVSIHQWISIQSPAVDELIPVRRAGH